MWKKEEEIRVFWIIKVQPFYKCNKFMLNLEQVPFNIIEERMQKTRTLDEREHLCHCYVCCLVTTVSTVQQTETMHEESLPFGKKKKVKENSIFHRGFQHKQVLTMKLTWSQRPYPRFGKAFRMTCRSHTQFLTCQWWWIKRMTLIMATVQWCSGKLLVFI